MKHILFLLLVMTFSSNIQTNSQTVLSLMPDSVKGWNQREADKLYTPETLYDYIDGGTIPILWNEGCGQSNNHSG